MTISETDQSVTETEKDLHRFAMLVMKWEALARSPWEKSRRFTFAECARELRKAIYDPPASVD